MLFHIVSCGLFYKDVRDSFLYYRTSKFGIIAKRFFKNAIMQKCKTQNRFSAITKNEPLWSKPKSLSKTINITWYSSAKSVIFFKESSSLMAKLAPLVEYARKSFGDTSYLLFCTGDYNLDIYSCGTEPQLQHFGLSKKPTG